MGSEPRAKRPFPLWRAFLIGVVPSGVAVAGFTNDWACAAMGAAIVSGLASLIVARFADAKFDRSRRSVWAWVSAAGLAFAVGQWSYTEWAYRREAWAGVFGHLPVGDLRKRADIRRYFAGGPGDRLTFMRFTTTSPDTVAAWVATMPPPREEDPLTGLRDGWQTWPQFWRSFSLSATNYGVPGWADVPPMREPRGYSATELPGPAGGPIRSRTIVWDAATGETFIVFSEG